MVCALAIFIQSSVAGNDIPKIELLSHDKLIHAAIYFIFAFSLFHALRHQMRFPYLSEHWLVCGGLLSTLYAISDETHQFFTPNRSSEIWDLNADLIGIALAMLIFWKFPTKAFFAEDQASAASKGEK
jgi:VanZ family protein